ncbi:MAG: sortase, partial [Clostridia bacterium]|nr:sortase [Clostridia bacterium]
SAISIMAGLLAASLILFSAYVVYDSFYTQETAFSSWELLQYKPGLATDWAGPLSGQDKLAAINEDYRAWLTLYETNIDYPVLQGPNDVYYASRDIYGEESLTGSIYLDGDNSADLSDGYNLIYGHHMANGAMFGGIDEYFLDQDYVLSHKFGMLVTPVGLYDLEVFAVAKTDAYDEVIMDATPERTPESVIEYLRNPTDGVRVVYFDEEAVIGATKVVALSTCESAVTDGRRVVFCVATLKNLIEIELPCYEGIYDAMTHTVRAVVNYPETVSGKNTGEEISDVLLAPSKGLVDSVVNYTDAGTSARISFVDGESDPVHPDKDFPAGTVVEYSTDGGETWTTELPSIKNVGRVDVIARAVNKNYGIATTEGYLIVHPRPVTVTANDSGKLYGDPDPEFSASVEGVIDDQKIVYTLSRPGAGTDEDPGTYRDAIVPAGKEDQGNYIVSYVPADFTITKNEMAIFASGYEGIYDAQPHGADVTVTVKDGTTVEYSTDGGKTWTTDPPTITNGGEIPVLVRATNPGYNTVEAEVTLKVTPRPVTVTAKDARKAEGDPDPEFEATVEGVIDGYKIVYTVGRKQTDETAGLYKGVIIPLGDEYQGNYVVTYVPADFVIDPKPAEPVPIVPVNPKTGQFLGNNAWALLNLICVVLTVYLLVPVFHLRDKFGRSKLMKQLNGAAGETYVEYEDAETDGYEDDGPLYRVKKFLRRLRAGVGIEVLTAALAIIAFILTENLRNPMVFIDKWTPLMLGILLVAWIIDVRLARYREDKEQPHSEQNEKHE